MGDEEDEVDMYEVTALDAAVITLAEDVLRVPNKPMLQGS